MSKCIVLSDAEAVLFDRGQSQAIPIPRLDVDTLAGVLRQSVGTDRRRVVHVLLTIPLIQFRVLTLPRTDRSEVHAAIARTPQRFFSGNEELRVTVRLLKRSWRSVQVLASACRSDLVATLAQAAAAADCRIARMSPASEVWFSLPRRMRAASVLFACGDEIVAIGRDAFARRIARSRVAGVITDLKTPIVIIGQPPAESDWFQTLNKAGARVRQETTAQVSARYAISSAGDFSKQNADGSRQRARRLTGAYACLTAATIGGAAAVEYEGLRRELQAVRTRRELLAPVVRQSAAVVQLTSRMQAASRAAQTASDHNSRWSSATIKALLALPAPAELVRFRLANDSLVLEGWAPRSGDVLTSWQNAQLSARLTEPPRREPGLGGLIGERFRAVVGLK